MSSYKAPKEIVPGYKRLTRIGNPSRNSYIHTSERNGNKVCLKCLSHEKPNANEEIRRECEIQSQLQHPFIMPLNGYIVYENYHYLEMPLGVGPIANFLITTHEQAFKIMYQIASAIDYLHSSQILHGDINPNNIVLMNLNIQDPIARVIDFGFARKLDTDKYCTCHNQTYSFSGPEIHRHEPHTFSADIWSLGATFYYIVTHKRIIKSKTETEQLNEALHPSVDYENKNDDERNFGGFFPTSGRDLIKRMLNPAPEKRPNADAVKNDPFFLEVLGQEYIDDPLKNSEFLEREKRMKFKGIEELIGDDILIEF